MEKSIKKRGRPAIKPYIKAFIASKVYDEQRKYLKERIPPKVLAYEIHKALIEQGEDKTNAKTRTEKVTAEPAKITTTRKRTTRKTSTGTKGATKKE